MLCCAVSCQALSRRGCHASALEVTKLLLALDPEDPVGGLLLLDYLALRAGEANAVLPVGGGLYQQGLYQQVPC
jgi:hypothetical protein